MSISMEPKPSLWLAIAKDGRVKYTTDSGRASGWKKSGSYRLVRDYYTTPVHASDISQERVDETAKREHEPWQSVQCTCGGIIYFKHTKREWVGLTDEEINRCYADTVDEFQFYQAIEAKLKERNNG
jgi:hypothetical protein